ncbi:hypothetical protein BKA67DRAFT_578857 [Truncatella angustata]|uniref:C2H2-type domain-containing protein n=1 Tax=Truncatella angustata TaxID=152316 RepID=A0A9P8UDG6_9PEZI|nr:uncharacterized protein BKA67DRAFT_578857 [Truncatella angustata]KAH6647902.1 hypothetical protein BKA67DRAFT_578857 [Truncatella angustata]
MPRQETNYPSFGFDAGCLPFIDESQYQDQWCPPTIPEQENIGPDQTSPYPTSLNRFTMGSAEDINHPVTKPIDPVVHSQWPAIDNTAGPVYGQQQPHTSVNDLDPGYPGLNYPGFYPSEISLTSSDTHQVLLNLMPHDTHQPSVNQQQITYGSSANHNQAADIRTRQYASSADTVRHSRTPQLQRGENPQICTDCNKEFRRPTELHKHQKRHIKPEKCQNCGYATDTSKDLKRHLDSCQREKYGKPRIPCGEPDCVKTFTRSDNRLKHRRNIHGLCQESRRRKAKK